MIELLGWAQTIILSLILIPQIIKTMRTKTVEGISLLMFTGYLIGNIIALIYGYMIQQNPLIFKYWIAIVTAVFYLYCYFKIKRKNNESQS